MNQFNLSAETEVGRPAGPVQSFVADYSAADYCNRNTLLICAAYSHGKMLLAASLEHLVTMGWQQMILQDPAIGTNSYQQTGYKSVKVC